jgi:hypothetical protein
MCVGGVGDGRVDDVVIRTSTGPICLQRGKGVHRR